jgi:hypothetical protein
MRFKTEGRVLKPADPILDIVPAEDMLVIDAKVSPIDIDVVYAGLAQRCGFWPVRAAACRVSKESCARCRPTGSSMKERANLLPCARSRRSRGDQAHWFLSNARTGHAG